MKIFGLAAAAISAASIIGPAQAERTDCISITSLPQTITAAGVYCLKQDLSTAITSGNAITINANNVTIDFNDFKLGGLAAGPATGANGVFATNRKNITIRNATIRGFRNGVLFSGAGSSGSVIEDNLVEGSTFTGITVAGSGIVVRRNRVVNTDTTPPSSQTTAPAAVSYTNMGRRSATSVGISNGVAPMAGNGGVSNAIRAENIINSQIVDNAVSTSISSNSEAEGIFIRTARRVEIARNTIFDVAGQNFATGIYAESSRLLFIKDNIIGGGTSATQGAGGTAYGIEVTFPSGANICQNNTITDFASGSVTGCGSTTGTFP
ncbi:right-handed parallel beta-helix repeat-containing protein [Mesorhizobium australicum]|uniref:Right handed beta helix region n=1 Tax=Mesorhizobium australicum TaxID=536018 RepID=A0A1X7PCW1_9HYPH|nr:hypothetical protein [Mesorhizobium australicum]SMH48236.1 Right handed beta helix region [Mesorhizobium australicum]